MLTLDIFQICSVVYEHFATVQIYPLQTFPQYIYQHIESRWPHVSFKSSCCCKLLVHKCIYLLGGRVGLWDSSANSIQTGIEIKHWDQTLLILGRITTIFSLTVLFIASLMHIWKFFYDILSHVRDKCSHSATNCTLKLFVWLVLYFGGIPLFPP